MIPEPDQGDERSREGEDAGADQDALWQGQPLALESARHDAAAGEETVESLLAELLPPQRPSRGAEALSFWLLLSGLVVASLAVGAIAAALLCGTRPVAWQAPLLAFDAAVIIFVVRSFLVSGAPVRTVAHRAFGLAGTAVGAVLILATVLRSAVGFIYAVPPRVLLTDLFVFGLLGLAGCMVFFECTFGRRWACRAAVVSSVILVVLLALQPLTGYGFFAGTPRIPLGFLRHYWPGSTAAASCGLGFIVLMKGSRRTDGPNPAGKLLAASWLVLLAGVVGFLTWQLVDHYGASGASVRLSVSAGLWAVAGLLPVMVVGAVAAWRERGLLRADMFAATRFAAALVALGGLACLALWLLTHVHTGGAELFLVPVGVLAAITGAWLTESRGDWVSRWALVPAAGLAVAALSGLGRLLEFAGAAGGRQAELWRIGAAALWCALAAGLTFAAAGLAVGRSRSRARQPELTQRGDLHLICASGWTLSGVLLCALFALLAGDHAVREATAGSLSVASSLVQDLGALLAGRRSMEALASATARLPRPSSAGLASGGAAALAVVLGLHVAAMRRARWALWAVALLWAPPVAAGVLLALLYATRLFLPLEEPAARTALGRAVSAHFATRLLLFVGLVGLVVRYWEALASVVRIGRPAARAPRRRVGGPAAGAQQPALLSGSSHLGFLVGLGVTLAGGGLVLALLLHLTSPVEAALFELAGLARTWGRTASASAAAVGQLSGEWTGYAAASVLGAFVVVSICEEARRGRLQAYPLLGTLWGLILAPSVSAWGRAVAATQRPPAPGRTAALAVTGLLLVALLAAAGVVWAQWWRAVRARPEPLGDELEPQRRSWAAHTLGSLGLLLCLAAAGVAVHAALAGRATYAERFADASAAASQVLARTAAGIDTLRSGLREQGELTSVALLMAAGSAAVLLLNILARYRIAWARRSLYALWCALALCVAAAVGYVVRGNPLGTWSAGRVVGVVIVAVVFARAIAALASPGSWLTLPSGPPAGPASPSG